MAVQTINDSLSLLGWGVAFRLGPIPDGNLDSFADRLQLLGHCRINFDSHETPVDLELFKTIETAGFKSVNGNFEINKTLRVGNFNGIIRATNGVFSGAVSGDESTGSNSASLGSNCPASFPSAPFMWLKTTLSDGTVVYFPAWK